MVNNFHAKDIKEVLKELGSGPNGLSREEAKKRLVQYGPNALPEEKKDSVLKIILRQFQSVFVYVLAIAAAISLAVGNILDFYVILAVIIFNAAIGFFEEYKAERAIERLKELLVLYAKVYRNGELIKIKMEDLVPGDVIFLEEGDKVPADARLLSADSLRTDEAALTGESLPVDKNTDVVKKAASIADRRNMVWLGTLVVAGVATAVVTATGAQTALGQVAESIAVKKEKGHLERQVDKLIIQTGIIATTGAVLVFLIGFFLRELEFFEIFFFSLASLVSGIPEGLPAVLAVVLAVGVGRMAKKKAIVRRLPAVETLGVATVIMSDKTGTLTENSLTVEKIILMDGTEVDVSGTGWDTAGAFFINKKVIKPLQHPLLSKLLHIVAVVNKGRVLKNKEDGEPEILGDPTEVALNILAEKAGLKKEAVLESERIIDELPFNSVRKLRSFLVEHEKRRIYAVGAFEKIVDASKKSLKGERPVTLSAKARKEIINKAENMAGDGIRVLAVGYRDVGKKTEELEDEMIKDLNLVGIIGMRDLPREGVERAIERSRQAGLRVMMVTGDHKNTAVAIAKKIGLIERDARISETAVTEEEIAKFSDKEFEDAVKNKTVFARVDPKTKLRIVEVLKKQGEIVAVTGDGVNDAPALRKSDIGIAMGITGTDVTREVGEIVLADDNFTSIVNAIEEGRIVFNNVRQTSFYLVTTNVAEFTTIIATILLGFPLPLLPIHILWINLITDGIPGIGLALEPGHGNELEERPRSAKENILSRGVVPFLIMTAVLMTAGTIFLFGHYLPFGIEKARTVAFTTMAFFQLFNSFNMRSLKHSVFKIGFWGNKPLVGGFVVALLLSISIIYIPAFQNAFRFTPLSLIDWVIILVISSLAFWLGEAYKKARSRLLYPRNNV